MAIFIDWGTKIIHVPQADLTPLGGSTYQLDVNDLRLTLKDLEDDEEGMAFVLTHNHVPPLTLAGIQFARVVEIVNGYTIQFEDGQYGVNIVGGNSNIADVLVRNQVSVNTANSAGLIVTSGGGGVDETTVRNAMTAQGYTTARAPKLDNLDALVSSRAQPGQGLTSTQDTRLSTVEARVDVATSTRAPSGEAATALTAAGVTTTRTAKLDNLDATISSRSVPGDGLSAPQATALAQIDGRVDVAVSTRAQPGEGLTAGQAAALALLDVAVSTRAQPGEGLSSLEAAALAGLFAAVDMPVSEVATMVWSRVVDGTLTAAESVRLMNAVLGGKVTGAGTGTERFRNIADDKDRVVSTVDAQGNRTSVVRDLAE